jgi:hypothetical protein
VIVDNFKMSSVTIINNSFFLFQGHNKHFVTLFSTENSYTKFYFIASFLVIIEYGVGIDSKCQC